MQSTDCFQNHLPTCCFRRIEKFAMAGTLTICSDGDGSLLSGHSWIVYQPDGAQPTTYGTWGNNPANLGNGLHRNLEAGRVPLSSRSAHLNDEQEAALMKKIKEYDDKGAKGWGYLSPCSAFAADTWHTSTGEKLSHRSGIISNPSRLKQSIEAANKGDGGVLAPQKGKPPSSSSLTKPVRSCPSSNG